MRKAQPIRLLCFCRKRPSAEAGSILILVVWTISFLSLLAVIFGARAIFSINLTTRFQEEVKSYYLAKSAALYAAGMIANDETDSFDGSAEPWFNNEYKFRAQSLFDGEFTISNETKDPRSGAWVRRYGMMDEDRKISLNTATRDVLIRLFEIAANVDEGDAVSLADAILDWHDEDSDRRPFGAEKFDYMGGDDNYECPDAPFRSIEELQLVKGVTSEIYEAVLPYVTVYGSGQVNVNTANPIVFAALGLSDLGANYIYAYRVGTDEMEGTSDDAVFNSVLALISGVSDTIPQEDVTKLTELNNSKLLGVTGEAFSFNIQSDFGSPQSTMSVDCVLDRKGSILSWFER